MLFPKKAVGNIEKVNGTTKAMDPVGITVKRANEIHLESFINDQMTIKVKLNNSASTF